MARLLADGVTELGDLGDGGVELGGGAVDDVDGGAAAGPLHVRQHKGSVFAEVPEWKRFFRW